MTTHRAIRPAVRRRGRASAVLWRLALAATALTLLLLSAGAASRPRPFDPALTSRPATALRSTSPFPLPQASSNTLQSTGSSELDAVTWWLGGSRTHPSACAFVATVPTDELPEVWQAPATQTQDAGPIADIVESAIGGLTGTYGIGVFDLDRGDGYIRYAHRRFPAASIYKLVVLYETQRQILLGNLSPRLRFTITEDDAAEPEPPGGPVVGSTVSVASALEQMIAISSNASARGLLRVLDRENVNRSAWDLGLRETRLTAPGTRTGAVNEVGREIAATSPADMLCLAGLLAEGQLLGPWPSSQMRGLLFRQQVNDRIPALLPAGSLVAHKTGELPGIRNDVGIVYLPRSTFALVVLSQGANEAEATQATALLGRDLSAYFSSRAKPE